MTIILAPFSRLAASACANSPGDNSAGSICLITSDPPSPSGIIQAHLHRFRAIQKVACRFLEQEHRRVLAALQGGGNKLRRQRRLAGSRRSGYQRAGAFLQSSAEQASRAARGRLCICIALFSAPAISATSHGIDRRCRRTRSCSRENRRGTAPRGDDRPARGGAPRRTPGYRAQMPVRHARCCAPACRRSGWSGRRETMRCRPG